MYVEGRGVRLDEGEAARWYRQAAEQAYAAAENALGFLYDSGQGVPENHVEAARWYRKAASQGNLQAEFNLGALYDIGQGVPLDHAEAARWYRKAARRGIIDAQFNLGVMYEEGQGVAHDTAEAARWYTARRPSAACLWRRWRWPICTRTTAAPPKILLKPFDGTARPPSGLTRRLFTNSPKPMPLGGVYRPTMWRPTCG